MADDVGNGVSLAGAWRALHHNPVVHLQQLNDLHLFVVVRLGKVQLMNLGPRRIATLGATDVGQTPERGQDYVLKHAGRFGQDRLQRRWQFTDCLDLTFKTAQVFNKHIAVAGAGKQDPGVCHT